MGQFIYPQQQKRPRSHIIQNNLYLIFPLRIIFNNGPPNLTMARFRFWLKLTLAFIIRFKALLLLAIVGGILGFIVINTLTPNMVLRKTHHIGISGRYRPDDLPQFITNKIGQGLTDLDEEGHPTPSLAESWETSDDGKIWKFKLKEGLNWQDGAKVTSQSINYNFEDVELETPDDYTVIFKLQNAFSPFPSVVSRPTFKKGLIGTGAWTVEKLEVTGGYVQRIVLEDHNSQKYVYRFYPSEDAAKTAFKLGHIDSLIDIIDPEPFVNWPTVDVKAQDNNHRYVAVFLNNENELFSGTDKKSLRQGLSYAINKEALGGQRAISPISPNSWAYNAQVKAYEYDTARASDLIGDLSAENTINITLSATPALLQVADRIAKDWNAVGVNTTVQVSSSIPTDFQAFMAIYNIPDDPDQYSTWHSTQIGGNNFSNFQNPRIDKLLEDGRLQLNEAERKKIYLDFQRFLLEEAPAIFLYHPVSYTITRK